MVMHGLRKFTSRTGTDYPREFIHIIECFASAPDSDIIARLWRAYQFGSIAHQGQIRKSGEPYYTHCAAVGAILAQWNLDADTISAGLLHDTIEDTDVVKEDLANEFSEEISELVDGVSKLSGIKFQSRQEKQAENFMKMFVSVAKDIRVIIIKFADRLHNMRTLHHLPLLKQRRIAIETRDVYAPLAHRLGMGALKWELEDLCLEVLDPKIFKKLRKKVQATRTSREKYIQHFTKPVMKDLEMQGIKAEVFGRPKHYFSIYGKMQRRSVPYEEIYDLLAIRIIVQRIEECYSVLGIIHSIYTPRQDCFKDYIAMPKINGYQSLHTTVFGENGRHVEVQIRTQEMDRTAEIGVAAHWAYKKNGSVLAKDTNMNRQIRWLRELVGYLQNADRNPNEFLDTLKVDLFQEEIFVFTPRGDVVKLRTGSTPVDFAFEVHSEVGFHCIGAKINGRIVPLNTILTNGDTVEAITSKNQNPNQAWLKFVKTAKAKTLIKKWIKKEQFEQSVQLGEEIVEKTLRRLKRLEVLRQVKHNPNPMGFSSSDLIFSAVGNGQITVRDILRKYSPKEQSVDEIKSEETLTSRFLARARGSAKGIKVDGVSNTLVNFGKCCNPIPGDEIVGYITRGRGVTVHRTTCTNLPVLKVEERFIDVEWDTRKTQDFVARLKVVAEDRKRFLRDVSETISNMNINIVSVDVSAEEGIATGIFIIQVRDNKQFERLMKKIQLIPGLIYTERM